MEKYKLCIYEESGQSRPSPPTLFTRYLDGERLRQHGNGYECKLLCTKACYEISAMMHAVNLCRFKDQPMRAETSEVKYNETIQTGCFYFPVRNSA